MTEIRIPVPKLPRGTGSNLLGLLGLIAVAVALGGLVGNWWVTVLVGGVFAVGLAYLAQNRPEAASARPVRPVAVAKSA